MKAASEVLSGEKPGGQRYAPELHVLLREFHADLAMDQQSIVIARSRSTFGSSACPRKSMAASNLIPIT